MTTIQLATEPSSEIPTAYSDEELTNPSPLKYVNNGMFHKNLTLACPSCGECFTHITNAVTIDGKDDYQAHPSCRGDVTRLDGWCESFGCQFSIFFGQHKGATYVWTEAREIKE
jgi:hypothetical protein